mgnify:FL=1
MHKYNAKHVTIDGINFPSTLEGKFYNFFKENGIEILELQPVFLLQDKCEVRGEKLRAITYKADFRIVHEWDEYIVDAKWMKTEVFKLKIKLWKKRYGHENNLIIAKSIKDLKRQIFE